MAKTVNNVKINATFATAASREQLTSGENLCTSLGKINKYLADLDAGAFTFPANGGNADTLAENSIDNFLKYNGVATDCDECTTRGVYQASSSTLNTPSIFYLTDRTPILITFDGSFQLFFTGVELYSRAYCIDPHGVNSPHWSDWRNVSDGGNANTVDGKHASDFASVRKLTTQAEVDSMLESGIYSVEGVPTVFGSISSEFYMLIVNRHRTDVNYNSELAIPYVSGLQQGVYYRNCAGGTWGNWVNVADGGNAKTVNGLTVQTAVPANAKFTDTTYPAASVSAAGLVSTGSQTFAGSKTFQETTHIRHSEYTKGSTAPSTTQFKAYRFSDNANKQMGEFSNYVDTNNNTVSKMLAVAATSLDGKIYSQIATLINADASYICHVCTTPTTGRSSLRQLASGTAEKNTTNCPSGAWYGKHS